MNWSVSTRDLKRVSSFAEAKRLWDEAKPWKNEHSSWRQFAGRRKTHVRLVKLSEERGYECVLYNTAIVTYMADGSVKLSCYDTNSTMAYAWCVRPPGCKPTSMKRRMFWEVTADDGDRYYAEGKEKLHLKPTNKGNWLLLNEPAQFEEQKYVPKAGVKVQRMLRGYRTWYETTKRLGVPLPGFNPKFSRVDQRVESFFSSFDGPPPDQFMEIATVYGDPDFLQPYLYKMHGAHIKVPAPFDRLPRIAT